MHLGKYRRSVAKVLVVCMVFVLCLWPGHHPEACGQDLRAMTASAKIQLDQRFRQIVESTTLPAPFLHVNEIKPFLKKEQIEDKELGKEALAFVRANMTMGEGLLKLGPVVQLSAANSGEIAEVWIEALSSEDEKVVACAKTLLATIEAGPSAKPSFYTYETLLAKHRDDLPVNIVDYMYNRDISEGFVAVIRATRDISTPAKKTDSERRERELLFAQHMVAHAEWFFVNGVMEDREAAVGAASKQLAKLAEAPEWWARLYAVNVVGKNTELQGAAWLKQLIEDKNERVRRAAQSVASSR